MSQPPIFSTQIYCLNLQIVPPSYPFSLLVNKFCVIDSNYIITFFLLNLRATSFMRPIISKNPFTGVVKETVQFISNEELEQKILKAQAGFEIQRRRTVEERAKIVANLGHCIQERFKEVTEIVTFEMGKPIIEAEWEVSKAIRFCKYYSENYEALLPQRVKADAKKHALVKYFPIGTIYYIVPFNFPFFLNFKGGLPNLLLGNTLLARNADSCPQTGRIVEEIMIKAGFGNGEYQNVYTNYEQIDQIFSHNSVGGVSFTGSSKGGAVIAEKAGKYLKRAVMELGGNDPFVVLADADLNLAVSEALRGRCSNAGQICIAPKRFIIDKVHYESFKVQLIDGLKQVKFGDPMNRESRMGPLARDDLYDNLSNQLSQLPKSYKIVFQRSEMQKPFFPITVIEGSDEIWDQELFGPVYQLFRAEDEAHAIRLANGGSYGLAGSVFSASRGEEVIEQIRCGFGFVNEIPKSQPNFPTGGVCRSGFGRDSGNEGFRQFANIKTHYIN